MILCWVKNIFEMVTRYFPTIRDHPHTTSDFRGGGGVSPNPMKSDDGGRGVWPNPTSDFTSNPGGKNA